MANKQQLQDIFLPSEYVLKINGVAGKINIKGRKLGRPSRRLTFNQSGLKIVRAKLTAFTKTGPDEIIPDRINHLARRHEVRLHSPKLLYPGEYEVEIDYILTDPGKFVPNEDFTNQNNRRLFPCIDHADAKAPIKIS